MWMNCIGTFQISPRRIFIVPSLFAVLGIWNIPVSFYTTDLYFLYHIIFLFNRMVFYEEFVKLGLFTKKIPNCIKYQATWWCQIFFNFHPYLGKWSNLRSIFFRWVGSTTNQSSPYKGPYPTGKTQSQEGLRDAMKNTMRELGTSKGWWFFWAIFCWRKQLGILTTSVLARFDTVFWKMLVGWWPTPEKEWELGDMSVFIDCQSVFLG